MSTNSNQYPQYMQNQDVDYIALGKAMTEEDSLVMAQLMLVNQLNLNIADEYAELPALLKRQEAIAEVLYETDFCPFPLPESITIVFTEGERRSSGQLIPKMLLAAWGFYGVEIYTAKEYKEKGKVRIKGTEKEFTIPGEYHITFQGQRHYIKERTLTTKPMEEVGGLMVYASDIAGFFAAFQGWQFDSLSDEHVGRLVQALRPKVEIVDDKDEGEYGFLIPSNNASYYFSISQYWIGGRNQDRLVNFVSMVNFELVDSRYILFCLVVKLADSHFSGAGAKGTLDGRINEYPNLYIREGNYGINWDKEGEYDHSTRLINLDLNLVVNYLVEDMGYKLNTYPYVLPVNGKHEADLVGIVIKKRGDAICDKYNMKFVGGPLAARAAGTATYVYPNGRKVKRTIHDKKGTKELNRPMQGRKFLSAWARIVRTDGTVSERERSKFTIACPEALLARVNKSKKLRGGM